jgi:cytochrome c oxidase cbb3-type subunit 3
MRSWKLFSLLLFSLPFVPAAVYLAAQEPAAGGVGTARGGANASANAAAASAATAAAIVGSKEEPAAVERGGKLYVANCGGCHGATGRGGAGAPDLVRSVLVLDDEKGILISPVLRSGRPDQGMPKPDLSEAQIADIVAWLHVQTYAAGHRGTYAFLDVVTGDPKKGESYFNSTGTCKSCHSATGDLKGIASRYDAFALQSRWLQPRGGRGGRGGAASARGAITVTVTLPSGKSFSGPLERIDDFNISMRDSSGEFHSFDRTVARDGARDGAAPKVEVHDPLKAHLDLLGKYTDADIHNVTAYLVTLK